MGKKNTLIPDIRPVDESLRPAVQAHLDDLTKPRGSLGRLEEIAMRYCLAANTARPVMGGKRIYCFAGDHGVAAEGVSAYPSAVTPQMVRNMLAGGAAINALARHAGAELSIVDMGVADPLRGASGLRRMKVRAGTSNMARGPAMTMTEAEEAVDRGIGLAREAARDGITLLGTGEMGIANSTAAAALFAALLPCPIEQVTGRGTGIDDRGLERKIAVIVQALAINAKMLSDPLGALAAVGGFEIAGICGLILGAASRRIPVVVDGFISSAGALVAERLEPHVRDYIFFSHLSEEKGHAIFFDHFKATPILDLKMRLGEGTGAALAMMIVEASVRVYNEMATFSSAGVSGRE